MRGVVEEPPGNPPSRCVGEKANSNLTNEKVSRRSTASNLPPMARDKERQRRQERRPVTICKKKEYTMPHHPFQTNDRDRRRRKASSCSKRKHELYPGFASNDISGDVLHLLGGFSPTRRASIKCVVRKLWNLKVRFSQEHRVLLIFLMCRLMVSNRQLSF